LNVAKQDGSDTLEASLDGFKYSIDRAGNLHHDRVNQIDHKDQDKINAKQPK
jgi:hypothetical protein